MLFRQFQVFLAYVFLSGKLANPDPPSLLVEDSTISFWTFPQQPFSYYTKAIGTCHYSIIYRATIAPKPTAITNYRADITVKQLLCIISFYYTTSLLLKL